MKKAPPNLAESLRDATLNGGYLRYRDDAAFRAGVREALNNSDPHLYMGEPGEDLSAALLNLCQ